MNLVYFSSRFDNFWCFANTVLSISPQGSPAPPLPQVYFKTNLKHMSLKENIFNILFL